MSFVFKILPESVANLAIDVALLLVAVAFLAMLIEKLRGKKGSSDKL